MKELNHFQVAAVFKNDILGWNPIVLLLVLLSSLNYSCLICLVQNAESLQWGLIFFKKFFIFLFFTSTRLDDMTVSWYCKMHNQFKFILLANIYSRVHKSFSMANKSENQPNLSKNKYRVNTCNSTIFSPWRPPLVCLLFLEEMKQLLPSQSKKENTPAR